MKEKKNTDYGTWLVRPLHNDAASGTGAGRPRVDSAREIGVVGGRKGRRRLITRTCRFTERPGVKACGGSSSRSTRCNRIACGSRRSSIFYHCHYHDHHHHHYRCCCFCCCGCCCFCCNSMVVLESIVAKSCGKPHRRSDLKRVQQCIIRTPCIGVAVTDKFSITTLIIGFFAFFPFRVNISTDNRDHIILLRSAADPGALVTVLI